MHLTFKLQREILQHNVFNNGRGKRPEIVSILNAPVCGQAASGDICIKTQTVPRTKGTFTCSPYTPGIAGSSTPHAPPPTFSAPHLGHPFLHCSHPASLFAESVGPFLIVPQGVLVTHRLDELEAFSSYTCGSLCHKCTCPPRPKLSPWQYSQPAGHPQKHRRGLGGPFPAPLCLLYPSMRALLT